MNSNTQRLAEIALRLSYGLPALGQCAHAQSAIKGARPTLTFPESSSGTQPARLASAVTHALTDNNVMVMCACCDTISQRMLLPFAESRVKKIGKSVSRLYTLSVGAKISRAEYHVDDCFAFIDLLRELVSV